jgi:ribosomal protein L31
MLKKSLAVLLIVCLQALSFAGLLATVSFDMNKDYIATNICENRAKPKLNCKGKCYLAKTQRKAAEQQDASDTTLKVSYFLVTVCSMVKPLYVGEQRSVYLHNNNNSRSKGWPRQSYHPPGTTC